MVVVLTEVSSSLLYLFIPSNQREDWKGMIAFFKSTDQKALILFESSGTFPVFDYYAGGSLNARGALNDFPAVDESSVSGLASVISERSEVYLVDYLVQISDPKRLVSKKLNELGFTEAETKDFHGVGFVYHYVK